MIRRREGSQAAGSDSSATHMDSFMRNFLAAILLVLACVGWGVLFLALSIP